jgi:HK97 family phage portal protein
LHIKLNAFEHRAYPFPLLGQTPLVAAFGDLALLDQIREQQQNFLANRAAPSAVLQTDLNLSPQQVQALRDRWNDAAKGLHAGGVPILTHGLKVQPWLQPAVAKDMQIAEIMKLTRDQIALVFRVPLAILGVQEASGSTTEQLYQSWLASGLGFCLSHLEEAFGNLFNLKGQPEDYCEFSTEVLLRSARKERVEMLVRGVMGGLFSPNEARRAEDLPAVAFGDEPRVQAQNVPLSAVAMVPAAPVPPSAPAAPVAGSKAYQAQVERAVEDIRTLARKGLATNK